MLNFDSIVAMGDSVTVGVRDGVTVFQTFSAILENLLHGKSWSGHVIAQGIGGETTNGALLRLPQIIALQPQVVTLMYGINDSSFLDGLEESLVELSQYRRNLEELIARLRVAGIEPVLLTPNPMANAGITQTLYGQHEPYRSHGINFMLEQYAEAVREAGRMLNVPIVDIYAAYAARTAAGEDIVEYLTDGMHPNPLGHELIAKHLAHYFTHTAQKIYV